MKNLQQKKFEKNVQRARTANACANQARSRVSQLSTSVHLSIYQRGAMKVRIFVRHYARGTVVGDIKVPGKKPTRADRINRSNMASHAKLYHLDNQFKLFNPLINTVLDVGFVPGNWSQFAKFRLCQVHGLEESQFSSKCHILGFDMLFGQGPFGVSTMQGDIYSNSSHIGIQNHFREQYVQRLQRNKSAEPEAYFAKEQQQVELVSELQKLNINLDSDWKPQLMMSDLAAPFLQDRGFFNNTQTRPYMRTGAHANLGRPSKGDLKSYLDLADAALVLACSTLAKKGLLLLRLAKVFDNDPELALLHQRLGRVFKQVTPWASESAVRQHNIQERFFVCHGKLNDTVEPKTIW